MIDRLPDPAEEMNLNWKNIANVQQTLKDGDPIQETITLAASVTTTDKAFPRVLPCRSHAFKAVTPPALSRTAQEGK